jgi:hypothetical protein
MQVREDVVVGRAEALVEAAVDALARVAHQMGDVRTRQQGDAEVVEDCLHVLAAGGPAQRGGARSVIAGGGPDRGQLWRGERRGNGRHDELLRRWFVMDTRDRP